jgi:hypothetical protein
MIWKAPLTLWRRKATLIDAYCGAGTTECHLVSAKHLQSNERHLNSESLAEYTGHLVTVPEG